MAIVITAKREGFRRCGIAHPGKPTSYPDDFFTEEQLRALDKEPQLILAYAEDEFVQVQERFNESLSQAALPQAPNTEQNAQPQALEASTPALGDAVVLPVAPVVGSVELGSDGSRLAPIAPVIGQDKEQLTAADIDIDGLWEEAFQEDKEREAAKTQAAQPSGRAGKHKASKAESEDK